MMKRVWLALGCFGSGLLWAAPAPVTVSLYTLDYPPFVIRDGGAPPRGIAVELIGQALERAGLRGQFVDLPWKRAQMQVQSDENSCLMPLTRSPRRDAQYRWVGLIDDSSQSLFVAANKSARIHALSDLKGLRVVTLLGSSMAEWLRVHQVAFSELATTEEAYRELSLGVADAWAVHSPVARYLVKKQGASAVPIREALRLQETGIYLACGKHMPEEVAQRLGAAIRQLQADGVAARISARYLE
ncbi:substrate-binding periplasmic protein [Chromobacterium vaccinii]|uniref:substrate-binding periplasmic protein n=1 Tax=Chromobacterium TaxID=535 RepID=UPI00130539A6|nr:transporter substrate-binding domain-containing protein [Chromobacterium sp. ATCC 53434]